VRRRLVLSGLLVVTTLAASACQVLGVGTPPHYDIQAEFPSTVGLYPGSFVRQLGINIGSVSDVVNRGDHVLVTMKINKGDRLAANADAILVGDSVLGERYVQFQPAYTGGATLPANTVLPQSRVTVPVETDTVLRSLNTVLRGISPTDVTQFTINLAAVLQGNGAKLNQLISNAAGTVSLLANKSQDLGQLTTTLANLSAQLGTRDQALATLIANYDLLSQTLAADRGQIDGVITQLSNVTTQATSLLAPNLGPIKNDVADLTTIGQTLDRNLPAIDTALTYAPRLFAAAQKAYDPLHNWLPLNAQTPAGETTAVLAGNVRDALASVCRRLAAKNPALAAALSTCGNPASSFFNPILGLIPTIVGAVPGLGPVQPAPTATAAVAPAAAATATSAPSPADATTAFARGIAAIPGLSTGARQALSERPGQAAAVASAPATVEGPPGAAAVAALAATPRRVGAAAAPARPAHRHHHRGLLHRFAHWVGNLL
jgi:phospholipid/cholesterol/gamma-HCH transport system substrate-binding protein